MDDLISRQSAIDKIETAAEFWSSADEFAEGCHAGYLLAANLVKALPSAERRGKWIETLMGWRCSVCGEEQDYSVHFKHCQNSGARMEV